MLIYGDEVPTAFTAHSINQNEPQQNFSSMLIIKTTASKPLLCDGLKQGRVVFLWVLLLEVDSPLLGSIKKN